MRRNKAFPGTWHQVLHRKRKPLTMFVDVCNDSVDFLVLFKEFFRMLYLFRPGYIRNMYETIDALFQLDKSTKISQVSDPAVDLRTNGVTQIDCFPWVVLELLHSKADPLLHRIDPQYLYVNLVAPVKKFFRALRPFRPGDLRNMNKSLDTGLQLYKNAVIGHRGNLALDL